MRLLLTMCLVGVFTPAVFAVHHQDSYIRGASVRFPMRYSGHGPTPASRVALRAIEQWERQGIRGRFETMGIAMQQLAEDYPELIEKMKRMRIPVTRYGGVGHQEPAPVGRMKDLSGMTLEESIVAQMGIRDAYACAQLALRRREHRAGQSACRETDDT